ncbi:MAG: GNAT family N-acetyltransferase [Azoarcus sp. PHD]|nr:MAG: GNAT family N-acetyltransferase [Azoarcus sp. PHD]
MLLKRISDNVKQLGVTNGVLYLTHRALLAASGGKAKFVRYFLVAQPVPGRAADRVRASASSTTGLIAPDDPITAVFPRPQEVIAKRFADGDQCIVANSGKRFAGFIWIARNHYSEDEVRCLYHLENPRTTAWDYDVYVEPDFRIGRTFARLWDTANKHLSSDGVEWSISRISAFNPASLQAHRRLGIQTLCTANFLCLGSFQLMIASTRPYLHVSLTPNSRPTLSLAPQESEPGK